MKIFGKLMTLVGGTIVCLVLAFCILGYFVLTNFGDSSAQKQLRIAAKSMQKTVQQNIEMQSVLSERVSLDAQFARAVAQKDVAAIRAAAKSLIGQPGVDLVTVTDETGRVLARGHSDQAGDLLGPKRLSAVIPLRDGKRIVGMEPGNVVKLTLASGTPVMHEGTIAGAVIVGMDLSSGKFVNSIKDSLDVESTIFLGDTRVSTTVMRDGKPLVNTPLNNPEIHTNVLEKGNTSITRNLIAGKEYDTIYWPWEAIDGKRTGIFFVGLSREDIQASQRQVLVAFGLAGLLLAVVLLGAGAFVAKAIVRPLRSATAYAQGVAAGNFNSTISATSTDEVGSLVNALKAMVHQLKEKLGFAQGIMHGIVVPFAVVDVQGKLTHLNRQLVTYWGLDGKPEDFYGKTSGFFFYNKDSERTPLDQVLADRKTLLAFPLARTNAKGEKNTCG